jgi:hypothetical protein
MSSPSELALFIGRFHPLLVHLPIGILLLLGTLEVLARWPRWRQANSNAGILLAIAVPVSAATAFCGWLLSLGGGYDARLVEWHQWTGIATAFLCGVSGVFYLLNLKKAYRFFLFANILVLSYASHLGGSLTHGSDYLFQYAPQPIRRLFGIPEKASTSVAVDPAQRTFYSVAIQPFFEQKCVACHGPEKTKGSLRLDSIAALLQGGSSGPAIVAGQSGASLIIKRMLLPLNHDEHMPPDGKPQASPEELALLRWWVDHGASGDKTLTQLQPPAHLLKGVVSDLSAPTNAVPSSTPKPLSEVLPTGNRLADELSIAVSPLSSVEPWLQVNAAIAGTNFGDGSLSSLGVLGQSVRWLDLGGTRITDAGLAGLAAFPNLVRLHLERTAVTDSGLAALEGLGQLEYLNLYGTEITDQGLATLQRLPKLKQLYLWQTHVTPSNALQWAEARVDQAQTLAWQQEIERLKSLVRNQSVVVNLGSTSALPVVANSSSPVNSTCPVSDKPVDPSKSVLYEGRLVAFCCDDCKAKFQQDPKPFLAKLGLKENPSAAPQDK